MATDYDAPRKQDDDDTQSIEVLKERSPAANPQALDIDETDSVDGFSVPDQVVSDDTDIVIVPVLDDEFTCSECFIVKHHSLKSSKKGKFGPICIECA